MKKILTILASILIIMNTNAQTVSNNIVSLQYYFDTDPGVGITGNGNIVSLTPNDTISQTLSIPITGLAAGMHNLYIRVMDDSARWSISERRLFYVDNSATSNNIIAYQYYFDTDPGVGIAGNGAIISITPTTNYTALLNITTPNTLTAGIHNLYIRVLDENGHWSLAERRLFFTDTYTTNNIVAYQYYFDTDPGVNVAGNGAIVPVTPTTTYSTTITVPVNTALSNGIHNLYIRMQDDAGKWSITERRLFFIESGISTTIVALECFYDNDPGVGNGIPINITPNDTINQTLAVYLPVIPPGAHNYYIRAKDSDGHWSIFERGAITALAGVAPSVIQAAGFPVLCSGDSVLLYTEAVTGISYQWMVNNIPIAGAVNDSIYVFSSGNYSIESSNAGVADTSNVINVTVGTTVVPAVSITSSQNAFCAGTSVTITANVVNGGANPTFDFKLYGVTIQNTTSNTLTIDTLHDGNYINCIMHADNACQTVDFPFSNFEFYTVYHIPVIGITTSGTTVCAGSPVTLTASDNLSGGRSETITWSGGITNGVPFVPANTTTYTVTVLTSNGCSNTDTVTVTVNPAPVITSSTSQYICSNVPLNYNIQSDIPSIYSWGAANNPNVTGETLGSIPGNIINDTLINSNSVDEAVNYTIIPVAIGTLCVGSPNNVTVTVHPALYAYAGSDQIVCDSANVTLNASASGGTPPLLYLWDNGITSFNTLTATLTATANQTYTFYVADGYDCAATDAMNINITNRTDISGHASYTSGNITNGSAVLYHWVPPFFKFDRVKTVLLDASGNFNFINIVNNDYLVKIFPNDIQYPTLVKTYYGNSLTWDANNVTPDTAIVIHHTCASNDNLGNITMVELQSPFGGPGVLSGYVFEGSSFGRVEGDPVPGVDVKVGRDPNGGLAASTTTDAAGFFYFTNLPIDDYQLYIDIPGLYRDSTYHISITAGQNTFNNLTYKVDSVRVFPLFPPIGVTSLLNSQSTFEVFPNPLSTNATIFYNLSIESEIKLDIYNIIGEKVQAIVDANQKSGTYSYNINNQNKNLKEGMYFVNLNINGKKSTKKIIILK